MVWKKAVVFLLFRMRSMHHEYSWCPLGWVVEAAILDLYRPLLPVKSWLHLYGCYTIREVGIHHGRVDWWECMIVLLLLMTKLFNQRIKSFMCEKYQWYVMSVYWILKVRDLLLKVETFTLIAKIIGILGMIFARMLPSYSWNSFHKVRSINFFLWIGKKIEKDVAK